MSNLHRTGKILGLSLFLLEKGFRTLELILTTNQRFKKGKDVILWKSLKISKVTSALTTLNKN